MRVRWEGRTAKRGEGVERGRKRRGEKEWRGEEGSKAAGGKGGARGEVGGVWEQRDGEGSGEVETRNNKEFCLKLS